MIGDASHSAVVAEIGGRRRKEEEQGAGSERWKVEGGEGGRRMDSIDVDEPFDVRYIYTWYLVWRL